MSKNMFTKILMSTAALLISTQAFASVTVNYVNTPQYQTTALTGYSTYGDQMDGMAVTATFADGSSDTATWGTTGSGSGGAFGSGWSISLSGDTFGSNWSLGNGNRSSAMTSLFIDAGVGDAVFDAISDPELSPGSARGWAFQSATSLDVTATYSGTVSVGDTWYGDLYRFLKIDIGGDGLLFDGVLAFISDTDNLQISGDIVPSVPEPGTFLLLGIGVAGMAVWQRRKTRQT